MLGSLTRYARSFFTSAPVSQEQAQAARDTAEVSFRSLYSHLGQAADRLSCWDSLVLLVQGLIRSPIAVFSKSYCPYCPSSASVPRPFCPGPLSSTDSSFVRSGTEAKSILSSLGQTPRMKVRRHAQGAGPNRSRLHALTTLVSRSQVLELDREALGGPVQQYLAEKAGASRVTVPQVRLSLRSVRVLQLSASPLTLLFVSQIYIKGENIGGCSELKKLQREGKLEQLLS